MDDRISSLPDDLLCHILSFLPTEQAVSTSVLSKRWKPLCIAVPVLNFENRFHKKYGFEWFIDATIQARDPQQPIRIFRLKYDDNLDRALADVEANVNVWVDIAIQHRGIEKLEIKLGWRDSVISLSCCRIFSCRTLVVLKLKEVSLTASSSVELPSLKSLHLSCVTFEEPQYFMELLYGCPMLEDLKTVILSYAHDDGSFSKHQYKNFYFPKLVRAEICCCDMDMDGTKILLKAISNVEFLTILTEFGVDDYVVPEFPHVRHLTLTLTNSRLVLLMLKNFPKLQSFKFLGCFDDKDVLLSLILFLNALLHA